MVNDFKEINKKELEKKLEENNNDVKSTLKEIIKTMSQKTEGKEEDRLASAVIEKYPNLSKEEIQTELSKTPNKEEAIHKLIELSHKKIYNNVKMAHQDLSDKLIFLCCEKACWVFNEALKLCEKVKIADPKEVLGIQAESIEYLAKDMLTNIKNNNVDKEVMEVQAGTIEYLAEDMEKNKSQTEVLKIQEGTVEYLAKDMLTNIKDNNTDKNVMEVQAGTIEYLAEDMEKNIKQLSGLKANQFINDFKDNNELQDEKRINLATEAIQPLLHSSIEPQNEIEKSDKDSIEYELVDGKLQVQVSLVDASKNSWIGFFNKSDPNTKYISYNWLAYLKDRTFVVDAPTVNGEYEFRAFKDKTTLSLSKEYVVNNEDTFVLSLQETSLVINYQIYSFDAVKNSSWVSIHNPEEENANKYRRFAYLKSNTGSITFDGFITDGNYQARIYSQNYFTNTLKIKSNVVDIKNVSEKKN